MSRRDFLVEIGTEELPPLSLKTLAAALAAGIAQGLEAAHLGHGRLQRFATPRRLAVLVKGITEQQPEQEIKRRGPPVSAAFDSAGVPTRAGLAFAASCGASVESLQRATEAKGEFLYFNGRKPGSLARDLLPGIAQAALEALPIPKRMRWGSSDSIEFVRPVHWVLMLLGKDLLPARILGVDSGRVTYGHRFHAPKAIRISTPGSYATGLRKRGYVIADFEERREKIRSGVAALAASLGGAAVTSAELLDEVTALVEWPVPIAGRFDPRFLQLPREVLIATLQDHQRYFPLQETPPLQGASQPNPLTPHFIAVANLESRDPAQVRAGNERVVRPRLTDAAFFYDNDRKQTLAARCADLTKVTFQAKLGTLADKTARVRALAGDIAEQIGASTELVQRAAELCKCDLLTAMVGEFPELQGVMGRYYALADGEDPSVADAIEQYYRPRFAGDELPTHAVATALALADKLETLTAIFAIGEKPTGNRDPFGLRRAAIGVLRILIEKGLDVDLRPFIVKALQDVRADIDRIRSNALGMASSATVTAPDGSLEDATADEVYAFIMGRLRAYYLEGAETRLMSLKETMITENTKLMLKNATITTEMFEAVLATKPASPLDFDTRLKALSGFLDLPEAASLAAANKRIANILKQAEAKGGSFSRADSQALQEPAERDLFAALTRASARAIALFNAGDYTGYLKTFAVLKAPIDAFFDSVMVMVDDAALRRNRLALLADLRREMNRIADLSRLPG
jgi:glycyl-tRNA synthetase beta chain